MVKRTFFSLAIISAFVVPSTSARNGITSADIITQSQSLSCYNWRVVGGCVWLKIRAFPPSVEVKPSIKVAHFIPDVVISAYSVKGENTWKEMSRTDDIADSLIGAVFGTNLKGGDVASTKGKKHAVSKISFKFATAIGNPLASTYGQLADYFVCESGATSFFPYFNSISDNWLWRVATTELVTNILDLTIPGKSVVGERNEGEEYLFRSKWGNIYPRLGFVSHLDDYKAAAVVATRVASIVTSKDAIHVSTTINGKPKKGYWPPQEALEWKGDTGKYQMLYPKSESKCHLFGQKNTTFYNPVSDNYMDRRDEKGNYAWNLWREYKCCKKEGQILLVHFGG